MCRETGRLEAVSFVAKAKLFCEVKQAEIMNVIWLNKYPSPKKYSQRIFTLHSDSSILIGQEQIRDIKQPIKILEFQLSLKLKQKKSLR